MERPTRTVLDLDAEDLDWWEAVLRPEDGTFHHAPGGCLLPDTVELRIGGRVAAEADPFDLHLDNQYCYDSEFYLVLRLRRILDGRLWASGPFPEATEGRVFLAFDKFHGHVYTRDGPMSYGGDFADLQLVVDGHPDRCPRISDASVLRAVREGDVVRLRDLLARGGNPNAGWDVPDEALREVSMDRGATALVDAILSGDRALAEALLEAGARLDAPPGGATPMQWATCNHKPEMADLLRRYGGA